VDDSRVNLNVGRLDVEDFGPLIESDGEGGQVVSTASWPASSPPWRPPTKFTKYAVVPCRQVYVQETGPTRNACVRCLAGLHSHGKSNGIGRNYRGGFATRSMSTPPAAQAARNRVCQKAARLNQKQGHRSLYVGKLVREGTRKNWRTSLPTIISSRVCRAFRGDQKAKGLTDPDLNTSGTRTRIVSAYTFRQFRTNQEVAAFPARATNGSIVKERTLEPSRSGRERVRPGGKVVRDRSVGSESPGA